MDNTSLWPRIRKYVFFVGLIIVAVVGNRLVQTHLGEQAIASTGFEKISLDTAIARADIEGKNVLVDMSAVWCPTCRKLDKEIFANADVQTAIDKDYIFVRVEYTEDEGGDLMKRYDVKGFPTLLVLDGQGSKLKQLPITFNPYEFINLIQQ